VPLAPIVLIAFACRLLWRLAHGNGREMEPPSVQAAPAAS